MIAKNVKARKECVCCWFWLDATSRNGSLPSCYTPHKFHLAYCISDQNPCLTLEAQFKTGATTPGATWPGPVVVDNATDAHTLWPLIQKEKPPNSQLSRGSYVAGEDLWLIKAGHN